MFNARNMDTASYRCFYDQECYQSNISIEFVRQLSTFGIIEKKKKLIRLHNIIRATSMRRKSSEIRFTPVLKTYNTILKKIYFFFWAYQILFQKSIQLLLLSLTYNKIHIRNSTQ